LAAKNLNALVARAEAGQYTRVFVLDELLLLLGMVSFQSLEFRKLQSLQKKKWLARVIPIYQFDVFRVDGILLHALHGLLRLFGCSS
jgi:hypothetical protein